MATTSYNNMLYDLAKTFSWLIKKDGTADINQGDIVFNDSGYAKPIASDANAATQLGVALKASYIQSVDGGTPYGQKLYVDNMEIAYGKVHWLNTVTGESYTNGILVYFDTDAQTVTATAGAMTSPIGKAYLPNGETITGAAGVKVPVLVFTRVTGTVQI